MHFAGTDGAFACCLGKGGNKRSISQCQTTNNSSKTNRDARNQAIRIRPIAAKTWNVRSATLSAIASVQIKPSVRSKICDQD